MEQTIYGDILLLINFSMDFLSLYLSAKLLHLRIRTFPMVAAASLGALYALLTLYLPVNNLIITLCNIAASCLLVLVAFPPKKFVDFFKTVIVFYGVGFLLGGCMTAVYNLCNSYLFSDKVHAFGNLSTLETELSFGWFVLLAGISAVLSLLIGKLFSRSVGRKTATVHITLNAHTVVLTMLWDSGNLLCDPISGTPVLVCNFRAVTPILFDKPRAFFANPIADRIGLLSKDFAKRIRVIPVRGVGDSGMLFAFRPDALTIDGADFQALVAVDAHREKDGFGGTDGLLPAAILQHFSASKHLKQE